MNKIKFLIIFFSFGWSVYMGSSLFGTLHAIIQPNLETLQQLNNEN